MIKLHDNLTSAHKPSFVWLHFVGGILLVTLYLFSIASVNADGKKYIPQHSATSFLHPQETDRFIVASGETFTPLDEKPDTGLKTRRKFNADSYFTRDSEPLHTGEKLPVLQRPLPRLPQCDDLTDETLLSPSEKQEKKLASLLSRTGTFLAHEADSHAAASLLSTITTDYASRNIQQWFSQFGSAQIKLNTDQHFSLKDSQLELLLAVEEQHNRLYFTQTAWHRTDNRVQANLGFGLRAFAEASMLGVNTFLDHDFSGNHTRLGLGIEYWRDFIKLGANSYLRVSKWQDSGKVTDYQARPANGWDIQAEGWLPGLPQLGGKVLFEQYYGQDVALFSKDKRSQNPYRFTTGLSYTPFPLLTLSVAQSRAKQSVNDTRFDMQLRYQLGIPWRQQLSPQAVGLQRTVLMNRYDPVGRNNNIVLQYKKKELIRLYVSEKVTGTEGETKSLGVSFDSRYPLSHIDWSAAALIDAGGTINNAGRNSSVVLPAYRSAAGKSNTYLISGTAVDIHGNRSAPARTQLNVTDLGISSEKSELTPDTVTLPADGKTQRTLLLKVRTQTGAPLDIAEDEITEGRPTAGLNSGDNQKNFSSTDGKPLSASMERLFTVFRRAPGEYLLTMTAGTKPGTVNVTLSARGVQLASAKINFVDSSLTPIDSNTPSIDSNTASVDRETAQIKSMDVLTSEADANGKMPHNISINVADASGIPVPKQQISLQVSNLAIISESVMTDDNGQAVVPVTSKRAGPATISAHINGKPAHKLTVMFAAEKSTAQILKEHFEIREEDIALADGKTKSFVAARVTDAQGNAIPGITVSFSADNQAQLAKKEVQTDANGDAMTTLTSVVPGISQVSATVNQNIVSIPATFYANYLNKHIEYVSSDVQSFTAGDSKGVTYTALVTNELGQPLDKVAVFWDMQGSKPHQNFKGKKTLTNKEGIATYNFTDFTQSTLQMSCYLNGKIHINADPVRVKAAGIDPENSRAYLNSNKMLQVEFTPVPH